MFRVLVIANTEAISKEAASWVVSGEIVGSSYGKKYEVSGRTAIIRAYPLWVNQKELNAIGDAVLIVAKTPEDLPAMESFINSYKKIPLKFILYDGIPEQPSFEVKFKAKPLKKESPVKLVENLIEANNELIKHIASVFKKFDKNEDGSIELSELEVMSKELGVELTKSEAEKMIEIMDTNKDGKISLKEFIAWWKTGCRGSSQKIFSLIDKFAKGNPIAQKIMEIFSTLKSPPPTDKLIETYFGLHLNKVKVPGLVHEITLMSSGKQLEAELQPFAEAVGRTGSDIFVGLMFGVKEPKAAVSTLENIVTTSVLLGTSFVPKAEEILSNLEFKYGATADKAIICAVPSIKGSAELAPFIPVLEQATAVALPNESLEIKLSFATDLEKAFNGDKTLLDLQFEGTSLDIKTNLHPYLGTRIYEIVKAFQEMYSAQQNPILQSPANLIKVALNSVKGEIELDPTPGLKEALKKSTSEEFSTVPVKVIKEKFFSGVKDMISSIPLLETVYEFLKGEVSNITLVVYAGGLGAIKIHLELPGLNTALTF